MVNDDFTPVQYCVLNVAATPHPAGVYLDLLQAAAHEMVQYHGDRWATISAPVEVEAGFYQGRIATWDEIDFSEPGIRKDELEEVDVSDFGETIPENIGFNGRIFLYTFRVRNHLMFVETKNEFGKSLSANQAAKIFSSLFSKDIQGPEASDVEITVVPQDDTLDRILALPRLKKLHIHLVRPNADDADEDAEEVLRELEEEGAKSQDIRLTAAAGGHGLRPNEKILRQARVAEYNGFVEGRGRLENGENVTYSTKAYPRLIDRIINEYGSSLESALNVAKEFVARQRRR